MENYFQLNNRFTSETDAADQMLEDVKKKYSDKVESAFQNAYFKNDIDGARAEEMKESIGNLVNLTPHLYKSFGQGQKDLPIVKQRLGDIQRTLGEKFGDLKESAGELRERVGERIGTVQTRLGNKNLPIDKPALLPKPCILSTTWLYPLLLKFLSSSIIPCSVKYVIGTRFTLRYKS